MSFEDLRNTPLCYSTLREGEGFLRCSRCKCAFYESPEQQKAHWKVHKTVCKEPETNRIETLSGQDCMKELTKSLFPPNANTAVLMNRLLQLMRTEEKTAQYGIELYQLLSGIGSSNKSEQDTHEIYYKTLWAVPGMPQFLMKSDLRGNQITALMKKYPNGPPTDEELPQIKDEAAECRSIFIVDILVRSVLWGQAPASMRDTAFSKAALRRLAGIVGDLTTRDGLQNLAATVVLTFHRVCEIKKDLPVECLNNNLIPALVELSSHFTEAETTISLLSKGSSSSLMNETAIANSIKFLAVPPISGPTEEPDRVVKTCRTLLTTILQSKQFEYSPGNSTEVNWGETPLSNAEGRMTLTYISRELKGKTSATEIEAVLLKWTELQDRIWELETLAEEVMSKSEFLCWKEGADEFKKYCQQRK